MKKETEGMLFVAQEQALRTNSIKAKIDKQSGSPKCRLCGIKEETVIDIDIAVPGDFNVVRTEDRKVEKYQDLAFEIKRIRHAETAILPVVIGALQTVPKRLIWSIERLGIGDIIASMQMTALLRT